MMRVLVILLVVAPSAAAGFDSVRGHGNLPGSFGNRDPSDPSVRVPDTRYEPVTASIKSFRPVDPLPWDELNRRVAPRSEAVPPSTPPGPN